MILLRAGRRERKNRRARDQQDVNPLNQKRKGPPAVAPTATVAILASHGGPDFHGVERINHFCADSSMSITMESTRVTK